MVSYNARMAELVDALVSGTSIRTDVQVRVLFRAQKHFKTRFSSGFCILGYPVPNVVVGSGYFYKVIDERVEPP
jgi:hypothetical protein